MVRWSLAAIATLALVACAKHNSPQTSTTTLTGGVVDAGVTPMSPDYANPTYGSYGTSPYTPPAAVNDQPGGAPPPAPVEPAPSPTPRAGGDNYGATGNNGSVGTPTTSSNVDDRPGPGSANGTHGGADILRRGDQRTTDQDNHGNGTLGSSTRSDLNPPPPASSNHGNGTLGSGTRP